MKKILSIFLTSLCAVFLFLAVAPQIHAAEFEGCSGGQQAGEVLTCPTEGTWVVDPEVTFTGKNAARSKELLNWTLQDYRWTFTQRDETNPLQTFWIVIRNIIYAVFILFVIATAFILIATRGKSISAMRFIPRFFAIVLLVTFSFSMISLLYQTTDLVQGFFLKSPREQAANQPCPPACISQEDLFFIDWDYEKFIGYRRVGDEYAESAFINLLLVKLTAFTYFTMVGMLFVRKIILWFFIILSPVFPLLLLYYPVRNTGKIWIGEFFRWLLYAPLFAIFLKGLVMLWRNPSVNGDITNIPLNFIIPKSDITAQVYPTATSILVGGPQAVLGLQNSANNVQTFALYLVALLMLWMVILLPWVLLQIFLEYAMSYNYAENPAYKGLMGWANRMRSPVPPGPAMPPPPLPPKKTIIDIPPMKKPILPPPPPGGAGLARTIPTETTAVYRQPSLVIKPMPSNVKTLRMTNLSVPTLRDVARFETAMVADKASSIHEISRVKETLAQLGNPASITSTTDRTRMTQIREQLVRESQAGNSMASTILNASKTMNVVNNTTNMVTNQMTQTMQKLANPASITNVADRQRFSSIKDSLTRASQQGNQFATTTLNSISSIVNTTAPAVRQAEIQKLKTELATEKAKGNELAKQVMTFITSETSVVNQVTNQITDMLQKISNPQSVTNVSERQQFETMKQSLTQASQKGDQFAATALTNISSVVNAATPEAKKQAVQKLQAHLEEGKKQGNVVAQQMTQMIAQQTTQTVLPAQNTVQTVSLEDYEAVRKMWEKNYQTMEVPQSVTKGTVSRKDWIQDDLNQISNTINMLSSSDAEIVDQGLQEVSTILPFLMMGGFTLPEITAYLKAKQQAATDSLEAVKGKEEEEESLVETVGHTTTAAIKHQTMAIPGAEGTTGTGSTGTSGSVDDDDEGSVLSGLKTQVAQSTTAVVNIFPSIMNAITLTPHSTPTIRDVVKYDSTVMSGKASVQTEVTKTQELLTQLADPTIILNPAEREKVQAMREQLVKESQAGNPMATSIIQAATTIASVKNMSQQVTTQVRTSLNSIMHPESVTDASQRATYTTLNQQLAEASQQGDSFAKNVMKLTNVILGTTPGSYNEQISVAALKTQVDDEKQKGKQLAQQLYPLLTVQTSSGNLTQVRPVIQYLLHPETLPDAAKQAQYREVHDLLEREKGQHNTAATTILTSMETVLATPVNSPQEQRAVTVLQHTVTENSQKGDVLAQKVQPFIVPTSAPVSTAQIRATVQAILHPETVTEVTRQQEYREIHDLLTREKENHNELATEVLATAATLMQAPQNSPEEHASLERLQKKVAEEKQKGNTLASRIAPLLSPVGPVALPTENKVQTVSLEDYEAVKKMWQDNYQNMDVPQSLTKGQTSRKEWIQDDIVEIQRIINLLSSSDPEVRNEGIAAVSQILPFLLIGGFSLEEIIAYLKAKLEAAKAALGIVEAVENEEDQQVDATASTGQEATQQAMTMEQPEEAPAAPPGPEPEAPAAPSLPEENGEEIPQLKELGEETELKDLADEPTGPKDLEELDKQGE